MIALKGIHELVHVITIVLLSFSFLCSVSFIFDINTSKILWKNDYLPVYMTIGICFTIYAIHIVGKLYHDILMGHFLCFGIAMAIIPLSAVVRELITTDRMFSVCTFIFKILVGLLLFIVIIYLMRLPLKGTFKDKCSE